MDKLFKINKSNYIVCQSVSTRNGFKHEAALMTFGSQVGFAKVCYFNRTWESFQYETVIKKLLDRNESIAKRTKTMFLRRLRGDYKKKVNKQFSTVGTVMALGNLLAGPDKAGQNDWKVRMLKAGLGDGVIMPEDWDQLSEDEKETRLNNIINEFKKE
jgi:hypothetical protein